VVSHFAFSASRQKLAFDDFVRKLHLEIRNLGRWTRLFSSQLVVGLIREYSEYERWKRRVKTFGLIVIIKLDHVGIANGDLVEQHVAGRVIVAVDDPGATAVSLRRTSGSACRWWRPSPHPFPVSAVCRNEYKREFGLAMPRPDSGGRMGSGLTICYCIPDIR
jgi:hypothetical protein